MAVVPLGFPDTDIDGLSMTMAATVTAHEQNTRALLNLIDGVSKMDLNKPRPAYNPDAEVNKWPIMLYHAHHGERIFGVTLVGLNVADYTSALKQNKADVEGALKSGWRREPYAKPMMTPIARDAKVAAIEKENASLKGTVSEQLDTVAKMQARMDQLEKLIAEAAGGKTA